MLKPNRGSLLKPNRGMVIEEIAKQRQKPSNTPRHTNVIGSLISGILAKKAEDGNKIKSATFSSLFVYIVDI